MIRRFSHFEHFLFPVHTEVKIDGYPFILDREAVFLGSEDNLVGTNYSATAQKLPEDYDMAPPHKGLVMYAIHSKLWILMIVFWLIGFLSGYLL